MCIKIKAPFKLSYVNRNYCEAILAPYPSSGKTNSPSRNPVFEATAIPLCRRKNNTSLNHVSGRFSVQRPSRFEDIFSKKRYARKLYCTFTHQKS